MFRSKAPVRANFLCMSQIFRNFEVKFEIRGISDENEAGTFSTNSVRDFTSSLLPLWITDASIVLPSLTRRLAGEIRQKAMP